MHTAVEVAQANLDGTGAKAILDNQAKAQGTYDKASIDVSNAQTQLNSAIAFDAQLDKDIATKKMK